LSLQRSPATPRYSNVRCPEFPVGALPSSERFRFGLFVFTEPLCLSARKFITPSDRGTVLTFTLAAFRLMTIRQPSTFSSPFVASHASPISFRRDVPLPAHEFSRGPTGRSHSANWFATCPKARLPKTPETGGAHGFLALRSLHPVRGSLGFGDPLRAESSVAIGVSTWRTHMPFS